MEIDLMLILAIVLFAPGLIKLLFAAIFAIFFYGDSETDKAQIEYLIEKQKGGNIRNGKI